MSDEKLRVLVVDDDFSQLRLVERFLSTEGFDVRTTSSALGVSNMARKFSPNVVLLDVELPALTGDQLVPLVRQSLASCAARLILHSACDPDKLRALAREVDADGWISKGDPNQLATTIRSLCESA